VVKRIDAKDWAREHAKGLWTSPMFPFTADYRLDEAGIRHNVEYMLQVKADGIGFGFSEPWVCTQAERRRAMDVTVDAVGKRVPCYLHATDHSVAETIALMKHAQAAGADAVMLWAPYEWAKTQEMAAEYFEYVGSQVDIAIFAYNTYHSGIGLTPETIARIAKVANVCAIKDALNDVPHTVAVIELCGKELVVSDPHEHNLLVETLQFGQQLMLGTTSVFLMQSPHCQPVRDYWLQAREGHAAQAAKQFYELAPLRDVWTSIYQVLWSKDGAVHPLPYIKYWMELNGMAAGPVRPPMHNLTEAQKADFKARLEASGWMQKLFPDRYKAKKLAAAE
jgi:4-hydroxy-tetrahydrodipicolinate synthase